MGWQSTITSETRRKRLPPPRDLRTNRLGHVPTATGGLARLAYREATKAGVNVQGLLRAADLSLSEITDDSIRVPVKKQIKFLGLVAKALEDESLGIRLAQEFNLREIGLLYYVLASSETLADAWQRVARYSGINNEGIRIRYRQHPNLSLSLEHVGVSRLSDHQQVEFFVTTLVRVCRHLVDRQLTPISIKLMHRRTHLPADLKAFFGCDVTFGSNIDEVVFSREALSCKVVSADPFLNQLLLKYCEEAVAHRERSSDWRVKVENAIVPLLPHGQADLAEVSRRLAVSSRTLSRRLASEGLTFAAVLDTLRQDLAGRYLRDRRLPISQIAWLLGYRQTSSFNHAFRRWTGAAPTRATSRPRDH